VVVWILDGTRVQARPIAADGTLGPTKNLTPAGKFTQDADVVVDSDGRATVVWNLYDGSGDGFDTSQVQARTVAPNGTLGSTEPLSKRATNHSGNPKIAIDPADRVTVAWTRYDGSIDRVQARAIAADGTVGSITTVSAAGQNSHSPEIAVDSTGRAIVVWAHATGEFAEFERVKARAIAADGSLGSIKTLSPAGENTQRSQVAVDSTGRATVTWEVNDGSNLSDMIRARTLAVDATLGSIRTLTEGTRIVEGSDLEIDSTDRATVVWEVGDDDYEDTGLLARSIAADGTLSTIEALTPEDNSRSASLAGDSSGRVTVVWRAPGALKYARSSP
jgi:microcompartment protein CcmK/EutM